MDRLTINPLTEVCDPDEFTDYHPARDGAREYWTTTRPLRIMLPGRKLVAAHCDQWETVPAVLDAPAYIDVVQGYAWDGASGPAIDDPQAVTASLVHDIICTPMVLAHNGRTQTVYPCPRYLDRHALYRDILKAQGAARLRAWYSWAGLLAGNWWLMLRED